MLAALSISFQASAQWEPPTTGYVLLRAVQQYQVDLNTDAGRRLFATAIMVQGYIIGSLERGIALGKNCVAVGGIEYANIIAVVRGYLEQHPAELSAPAYVVINSALEAAFPCK